MYRIFLYVIIAFTALQQAKSKDVSSDQQVVEKILDNLYQTNGNKICLKPQIKISTETLKMAAYYPRQNVIELEQKAIDVCRQFGPYFESALAFIISHELAHAQQKAHQQEGNNTSYLAFDYVVGGSKRGEHEADVHGLFNAYLAGYQTIDLLSELIEKLYEDYDLVGKELSKYPSLDQRKYTAQTVEQKVQELVYLFEAANYLSALGKYELAAETYGYIASAYQGREIYNNQAVNFILYALNFTGEYVDSYLFPIELDWNTRIRNPKLEGGSKALDAKSFAIRIRFLNKAKKLLQKALELDPGYTTGKINLLNTLTLLNQVPSALQYYESSGLAQLVTKNTSPLKDRQVAQLSYANALALSNSSQSEALDIWSSLKNATDPAIAFQADFNLKTALNQTCSIEDISSCHIPFPIPEQVDGVVLDKIDYRPKQAINNNNNIRFAIQTKATSRVFDFDGGTTPLALQIIDLKDHKLLPRSDFNRLELIQLSNGAFLVCHDQQVVLRLDRDGRIREWGKFGF